jgi:hypothetical protein
VPSRCGRLREVLPLVPGCALVVEGAGLEAPCKMPTSRPRTAAVLAPRKGRHDTLTQQRSILQVTAGAESFFRTRSPGT